MSDEPRKLYRSRTDRMISGVCGGLGKYLGMDPTVVRLVTVLCTFVFPVTVLIYIIMVLVIPEDTSA
jgi:phage shock protein C